MRVGVAIIIVIEANIYHGVIEPVEKLRVNAGASMHQRIYPAKRGIAHKFSQ